MSVSLIDGHIDDDVCCENCINYNVDRDEQPCCCCFDFLYWEEENENDR